MSVLIKGMEMPKSCLICVCDIPKGNCDLWRNQTPEEHRRERHPDCPLVEVPTPHGRLIDADALVHDLDDDIENDQRVLDEMDFVGKERDRVQFDKDCKHNCLWYLSEAPTIIESE